ncbi:MAG: hypothetical protein ACE5EH_03525 [Gammaproteobacteria bacterium]
MIVANTTGFKVIYYPGMIVLIGETGAIHREAQKLLMKFMSSALPYCISEDTDHRVVLESAI